jgi:O-antigen/teichoic acid export membrane protein
MGLFGKKDKEIGKYAYLIGLALSVILTVIGAGIASLAPAMAALVIGLGFVVVALNVKAAEGQKFLLWVVAAGVTSIISVTGTLNGAGLDIVGQLVAGVAMFFGGAAIAGVLIQGHKLLSK